MLIYPIIQSNWYEFFNVQSISALEVAKKLRSAAESEAGSLPKNKSLIISPVTFPRETIIPLEKELTLLANLIFDLPERIFNGNWQEFLSFLGYSEKYHDLFLMGAKSGKNIPIRWDLIQSSDGKFSVLEVNAGYAIGGQMISHNLSKHYKQEANNPKARNESWSDTPQIFADYLQDNVEIAPTDHILVIQNDDDYDYSEQFIKGIRNYLGEKLSCNVSYSRASEIKFDGDICTFNGKPITHLMLYPVTELLDFPENFSDIRMALEAKKVKSIVNFMDYAFQNKRILALLCDPKHHEHYSAVELDVIKSLVPHSMLLDSSVMDHVLQNKDSYVFKPASGYGGIGIVCGWESSQQELKKILLQILKENDDYIVQKRVVSSKVHLSAIEHDLSLKSGIGEPVYGLLMLKDKICGGVCRSFISETRGVVNVVCGAGVGPVNFT